MAVALLTSKAPGASTPICVTFPSFATSAKRWLRMPRPRAVKSISSPNFLMKSPLPSASMTTLSLHALVLGPGVQHEGVVHRDAGDHIHALGLQGVRLLDEGGQVLAEQVGVKAPGTPNSTAVLPPKISSVEVSFGPSGVPA